MDERRNYDVRPHAVLEARGKPVVVTRHARDGMVAERPPLDGNDVGLALEEPDHDDGKTAQKRIGKRTVIVRYRESDAQIAVVSVSATRRRLRA